MFGSVNEIMTVSTNYQVPQHFTVSEVTNEPLPTVHPPTTETEMKFTPSSSLEMPVEFITTTSSETGVKFNTNPSSDIKMKYSTPNSSENEVKFDNQNFPFTSKDIRCKQTGTKKSKHQPNETVGFVKKKV